MKISHHIRFVNNLHKILTTNINAIIINRKAGIKNVYKY